MIPLASKIIGKVIFAFIGLMGATLLNLYFSTIPVYADEVWGSHVVCYGNSAIFQRVYSTYGGSDWYPVTVMISVDDVPIGIANLQSVYSAATNGVKIKPILRLTTNNSLGSWEELDPASAAAVLTAVDPAGFGLPLPISVMYGNEPNMREEWGGTVDPVGYGTSFRAFASLMGGSNYAVSKGPLNLSFPDSHPGGMDALEFYNRIGSLASAQVMGSNPYELSGCPNIPFNICGDFGLSVGAVGFPGSGQVLTIPNHATIDSNLQSSQGGPGLPRVFTEFGLKPDININARKAFLERAYAENDSNYRGTNASVITPLVLRDREAGAGEQLPYIAVFKNSGGVEFINCNTEDCGTTVCNGGSFTEPPNNPLPPATCTPGEYSLNIKGKIRSSREGIPTYNPLTGGDDIVPINFVPLDQQKKFVKNQNVKGAVVAIYAGEKNEGGDVWGDSIEYSSGKVGGKIPNATNFVVTEDDGVFELSTSNVCTESWEEGGYRQYLVVMCTDGDNLSTGTLKMKGYYSFVLDQLATANSEIKLEDFFEDCEFDLTKYGTFSPPASLDYVVRQPDKFLACSGEGLIGDFRAASGGPGTVSTKTNWDFHLEFRDDWNNPIWNLLNKFIPAVVAWVQDNVKFEGQKEGRTIKERVLCDNRAMFSHVLCFFGGCKSGYVELPNYYLNGAPAGDNYNNWEQKPKMDNCEDLLRCNMPLADDTEPLKNSQTCGGSAIGLRDPYDAQITDASGNLVLNEAGLAARFLNLNKDMEVCKDTSGTIHKLVEFIPPAGFCGDLDGNGSVSGNEVTCPSVPKGCGPDLGIACPAGFTFDERYFPFQTLWNIDPTPVSSTNTNRIKTHNDSVSSYPFRTHVWEPNYKPENDAPNSSLAFWNFDEQKFCGFDNQNCNPKKTSSAVSTLFTEFSPVQMYMATPQNTGNAVTDAQAALSDLGALKNTGKFKRLGNLDALCTCSMIENGVDGVTKQVENCLTTGANVRTTQPGNMLTAFHDENIGKVQFPEFVGAANFAASYKYMTPNASRGDDQTSIFYAEPMSAGFDPLGFITDFVDCVFGSEDPLNNHVAVSCGRRYFKVAQNDDWAPWRINLDFMQGAYVFFMSLAQPLEEKITYSNACENDYNMTKAQFPTAQQGYGYVEDYGPSTIVYGNMASSAAGDPGFGGVVSDSRKYACWRDMPLPSTIKGLFDVSCSGSDTCSVAGTIGNSGWTGGSSLVAETDDGGRTWSNNIVASPSSRFIHGISLVGGLELAVGEGGRVYRVNSVGEWYASNTLVSTTRSGQTNNARYLYDITSSSGRGYLALGTGHVFYSSNGGPNTADWRVLNTSTCATETIPDSPPACVWSIPPVPPPPAPPPPALPLCCDDNGSTPNPDCADNPCWKWDHGSLWGADCSGNTCMIVGSANNVWKNSSGDLSDTQTWWDSRRGLPACSGSTSGTCQAFDVSLMGSTRAVVVGGGADDFGGHILLSTNGGQDWQSVLNDTGTSLRAVDCTAGGFCVAAGTHGRIYVSSDAGATWAKVEDLIPNQLPIPTDLDFWGVHVSSQNAAYVAGRDGAYNGVVYSFKTNWELGSDDWSECLSSAPTPGPI